MQHRHVCLIFACLLLVAGSFSSTAYAQVPSDLVTSADLSPDQKKQLDGIVAQQVVKLTSPDASNWAAARTTVAGDLSKQGITPGFLDAYADSLNRALLPVMSNKDARIRLNAAIIIARVAAKADNGRLAPVVEKCLSDENDGVVLWGLQAAKFVLPALLKGNDGKQAGTLGKAAVAAAESHPTPAVIEEAYRTVLLDPTLPTPNMQTINTLNSQILSAYLPVPMSMLEFRVKQYEDVDPPKQATADNWATLFLTDAKVWGAQTPPQQGQTVSLLLGLLKGVVNQNKNASSPELLDMIKRCGQEFKVVGGILKKPDLSQAAEKIATISSNTSGDEIATAVDTLDAAVKALGLPVPPPAAP